MPGSRPAQAGQSDTTCITFEISLVDFDRLRELGEEITDVGERFPEPGALVEACVMFALDRAEKRDVLDRRDREELREYARERRGAR